MLVEKSVGELGELLSSGKASAVEIVREYLGRLESLNPIINAYITIDGERALKEAEASDRRRSRGEALSAWDGVPVALKDNICVNGVRTTCGSSALRDYIPPYDATAYVRLREQGFLCLGKTNMDEFGMGSSTETSFFGPTKNPYNDKRVPGGSSGGSAAAVVARLAPFALGSDTGGSIRQPASFCGIVGIKPTYGRVSRYGLIGLAPSLDQVGVLARTVDDAALLLGLISGRDSADSTSVDRPVDFNPGSLEGDVKGMVIGVPEEYFKGIAPGVKDAVNSKIKALESLGARVEPISLQYTEWVLSVFCIIAAAEASSSMARYDGICYGHRPSEADRLSDLYDRARGEGFGQEVKRRILLGTHVLGSGNYEAYYLKAQKGRTLIIQDFHKAFAGVDCILGPVSASTAFALEEKMGDPLEMYISNKLTAAANLAAIPAMSVPIGLDEEGLPIGLQIMAGHFEEKKILNCAKAIESLVKPARPEL